jgi:hypothetical protein
LAIGAFAVFLAIILFSISIHSTSQRPVAREEERHARIDRIIGQIEKEHPDTPEQKKRAADRELRAAIAKEFRITRGQSEELRAAIDTKFGITRSQSARPRAAIDKEFKGESEELRGPTDKELRITRGESEAPYDSQTGNLPTPAQK